MEEENKSAALGSPGVSSPPEALSHTAGTQSKPRKQNPEYPVETVSVGEFLSTDVITKMKDPMSFVKKSFPTLNAAVEEMFCAKKKFAPEKLYRAFFDDFVANIHDWKLFYSIANNQYVWAERTCGVLGNLATIYRQRRDHVRCDEVMIHYKFIIVTYNTMIALRKAAKLSDQQELSCCSALTFKYHKIAAYLGCELQRTTGMAESYRYLMQYEFETGVSATDDEYVWMLTDILRKPRTLQALQGTTDRELMLCCEYINEMNKNAPPEPPCTKEQFFRENPTEACWGGSVQLAACAGCQQTEPFLSTYKACGRCKSVKYCGRECQVAHHKDHKAACKQAAEAKAARSK